MAKYVILLHFYVFLLQKKRQNKTKKKKKPIKIQDQKEFSETLVLWDFKPQVSNLNFSQTSGGYNVKF